MKRFFVAVFYTFIVEIIVIELINIIGDYKMTPIYVVADALFVSVIGVGVARGIQYAIKAAKEHEA